MKPPKREQKDFERVAIGEMIKGELSDIQYDMEHVFKGFQGKEDTKAAAVRFVFTLEGYKHKHFSRWMRFNYGAKSNLFSKYLCKLVAGAVPDMDYDLDFLKGMKVKTLWSENNGFQTIESIFPLEKKEVATKQPSIDEPPVDDSQAEEMPF